MTDKHIRAINRAIVLVEDHDIREEARTALHHVFGRESKLREENERLKEEVHFLTLEYKDTQARLSAAESKTKDLLHTLQYIAEQSDWNESLAEIAENAIRRYEEGK